ncbi:MAG: hypothetical protein IH850_04970 [Acidobacteria bacterium]|nr:hypothetical protein [Acidobacteriota bacterium]
MALATTIRWVPPSTTGDHPVTAGGDQTFFSDVKDDVFEVTGAIFIKGGPFFQSIQASLNVAASFDTIVVQEGTYNENLVVSRPDLTLLTNDHPEDVIIQGLADGVASPTIDVLAGADFFQLGGDDPGVTVVGDPDGGSAVIEVGADGVTILNNIILLGGADTAAAVDFAVGTQPVSVAVGDFNADGDIRVGPTSGMPNIVFDGCIHIYDAALGGGALNGKIIVRGCHATAADLDICIDGPDNNNVIIQQTDCPNQVDWSCPDPACP